METDSQPRTLSVALHLERLAGEPESAALEIPVSFASDRIVPDPWLGPVRLSLDVAAVDLTLGAAKGIPVREMHQRALPVARVMSPRIEGGVIRGTLKFSQSERGRSLYRDAIDGILTDLSVGAAIHAVEEHPDHLLATRWEPVEVSIVDVGADPSVGINRVQSLKTQPQQVNTMANDTPAAEQNRSVAPAPQPPVESQEGVKILALARYANDRAPELGILRMGEDYANFGKPFEEFKEKVWSMMAERQKQQPSVGAPAEIGLTHQETQQYSIVRASLAALTGDWKKAGFELEASRAIAERMGRPARGFFVPLEVQRTLTVGQNAAGGYLVANDQRADLFIESLRAQSVAFRAGVRQLPGLMGNVAIPKQTGGATFYWLSEGEGVTASDPAFGQVTMTPRTIGGGVAMTRRLLMQSSPAVEQLVRSELIEGAALAIDLAVFEGDGVKTPLGIVNHGEINTVSVTTDGSPTWAELVQFESEVAADNALAGALAYVTTPGVLGKLKTTSKDTGSGTFLSDGNNANGYPVLSSAQLAANTLLFGAWSNILVGFWGVLEVKPDEATNAASGGLILRVFQDADVAIRHGKAFAKGT